MTDRIVLDSSVILAILFREPLRDLAGLTKILPQAVVSSVNLAEVVGKLVGGAMSESEAWRRSRSITDEVIDFDSEQARIAGNMIANTKPSGLSLGDRACLALGVSMNSEVYTTDRAWKDVQVGARIHVLR